MKTFKDLIEEVQKTGLCHHCCGCLNFCTAINYGALAQDEAGQPYLKDEDKCIECGLCYTICPETGELEKEIKEHYQWSPPIGSVQDIAIARSIDKKVFKNATDGGVVTALLQLLLREESIDGAIVSKPVGPFRRQPYLATNQREILEAAGFSLDLSHGMQVLSQSYSTYTSSVEEFKTISKRGLHKVALVGTPCQIRTVRKMQYLNLVPSDSIKYCFGLFCSGSFSFGEKERQQLESIGGFSWEDISRINIKDRLIITLNNGETKSISLEDIDFLKRYACRFCTDYTSEFADISFGGLGAPQGWTTIITRTSAGHSILKSGQREVLECIGEDDEPEHIRKIAKTARWYANQKRQTARENRQHYLVGQ